MTAITTKIWLSSPHIGENEQNYVKEAFDTNWVAPLGPNVNSFEASIENYLDKDVLVAALSSGTAAIHLGAISDIEFLVEMPNVCSNWWLSCILTPSVQIRENIRLALQDMDVESRPLWKPMQVQPVFEACEKYVDGTS